MKVGDEDGAQALQYLDPKEARELLGIWISLAKSEKTKVNKMKRQVVEWTERLQRSALPPHLGEMSFRVQLWPRVSYAEYCKFQRVQQSNLWLRPCGC